MGFTSFRTWSDWKKGFVLALVYHAFLALIVLLFIWLYNQEISSDLLKSRFDAWDGKTYTSIALHGYPTNGEYKTYIAFFPFYPLLIRFTSILIKDVHLAGIVISVIGSLIGHTVLYRLLRVKGWSDDHTAKVLLLLFVSPATLYFMLDHTEGVFLACTVLLFLSLEYKKWKTAILISFLATFTRIVGLVFLFPLAFSLWNARKSIHWRTWVMVPLVCGGFLLYLGLNLILFGSPFHYQTELRENWQKYPVNPIGKYVEEIRTLYDLPSDLPTFTVDTYAVLITPLLLLTYIGIKRKNTEWSWVLFSVASWIVIASQSYWLSSMRYIGLIIPLYPIIVEITKKITPLYYVLLCGSFALALLAIYHFALGRWVY